ncbi:MAG: recombinase family protein [Ruminococcus flavefaciens]|nr:recombinase family protein [Ruminococcus flavefaciens]MCM1363117.1 recombinase family protein [Clostridiales bacterium]
MGKVKIIEAIKPHNDTQKKARVATYCRVSTDNSDQLESLETQKAHYESWIQLHTDWEYAGLFYDTGITGTKAEIREGLQNLLTACRMGKVDHILVKSISRFSRNTTDCLSIVRELLYIGVTIYFEKENINTGEMESELILSILSSMAEDESASISENEKWSIQRRMAAGTYKMPYVPYGYQRDENGNMVIEQSEAEVVRYIFNTVLAGHGTDAIAAALERQHIPTRKGGKWSGSTVRDIIVNEKYVGDALFQKTYTDDAFQRHINHGEVKTYLISEHHEPIIKREVFDKANALIRQRGKEKGIIKSAGKYQNRYAFSGKIICGICGGKLIRRIHDNGTEIAWACKTHITNINQCSAKYVRDDKLKAAFVTMLNKLIFSRKLLLKPLYDTIRLESTDESILRMQELQKLLETNSEKKHTLRQLRAQEIIDSVMYNQELNMLRKAADDYRNELAILNCYTSAEAHEISEMEKLLKFVETTTVIEEFNDELFLAFVDHIIAYGREYIEFKLKCGLTLKEVI